MNNPLYNKIASIVASKSNYGSINHSAFDGIRNKSSVCAVLTSMGFEPCNKTRPYVWSLPNSRQQTAKPKEKMKTKSGYEVLNELKENGIFYVADFKLSRKYLTMILIEIRALGYDVESIRESYSVVAYKMNRQ